MSSEAKVGNWAPLAQCRHVAPRYLPGLGVRVWGRVPFKYCIRGSYDDVGECEILSI